MLQSQKKKKKPNRKRIPSCTCAERIRPLAQIWQRLLAMDNFTFYRYLQYYALHGVMHPDLDRRLRSKVRRVSPNFILKDHRLFYTGPSRQFMRLVVLSEDERRSALMESHVDPGTGTHMGTRSTRDRVVSGYYWSSLIRDVEEWVKSCHQCQLKNAVKTVRPVLPVIKVKEAWEVLGLYLIGPLPETVRQNKFALTLTDLHTKYVIAEPLQTKSAPEVSTTIINKLYTFGLVRKIITDQTQEFVDQLNESIVSTLNIKNAVSIAHPNQTKRQDERTCKNIKRTLRSYVKDGHSDWDLYLPAVVYGHNITKQRSTRHTPYFLLFNRNPRQPEVMNACPMGDDFVVAGSEDDEEKGEKAHALQQSISEDHDYCLSTGGENLSLVIF
uniref:Gypsy retrotransposon integrase-like protein 1 n=1 Tax=Neogobius melanostomus TaxID=47308 RepID=A0A8C6WJ75_9GOBI